MTDDTKRPEPVAWVHLEQWKSGQYWPDDCFSDAWTDGKIPLYASPPADTKCPACKNTFLQPFVCVTCGAEKLYDATVASQEAAIAALKAEIEQHRVLLVEARAALVAWENCFGNSPRSFACVARIDALIK
jgi:hypothetical protein